MNLNLYYWVKYRRLFVYGLVDLIGGLLLIIIPTHSGITNLIGVFLFIKAFYMFHLDKEGIRHLDKRKQIKFQST